MAADMVQRYESGEVADTVAMDALSFCVKREDLAFVCRLASGTPAVEGYLSAASHFDGPFVVSRASGMHEENVGFNPLGCKL